LPPPPTQHLRSAREKGKYPEWERACNKYILN
jgi:hypothetical protein